MTDSNERCSKIIDYFAESCERMNDFQRTLDRTNQFRQVTSGSNIRKYLDGWKLEKWIEAELNPLEGLWACWWLELGFENGQWLVHTNVSISHSDTELDLTHSKVDTPDALRHCLNTALNELEIALDKNSAFRAAVDAALARSAKSTFSKLWCHIRGPHRKAHRAGR